MKNFKCILIATLLVLASCQREAISDTRVDVTFVATSENRTKTALVNNHVLWEEGDCIKVMWDGGSVKSEARVGDDREIAAFTASVPEGYEYYAVTPYVMPSALQSNKLSIEVPQSQDGTFACANIACGSIRDVRLVQLDLFLRKLPMLLSLHLSGSRCRWETRRHA